MGKKPKWEIIGDKENTEWMVPVSKCVPSWVSFSILKNGLAIMYPSNDAVCIQLNLLETYVKEMSEHCRKDAPGCAMMIATGMTCYEIMQKACEKAREKQDVLLLGK